jgi:hypothetical protein
MAQLARNFRRVAATVLMVTATASFAAAQGTDPRGQGQGNPEQAKRNLDNLADALARLHPDSAELAKRSERLKAQVEALTPEQLSAFAPELSAPGFTSTVERLTVAASAPTPAFALRGDLDGAEYDSCGNVRSDTDSGRDLVIASDSVNIAAIAGDVACNIIVVVLGEGSTAIPCAIAGVLHEAVQAINFERDLRNYCDGVIEGNETRGILKNTNLIDNDLAMHDADIKTHLATHDAEIKAALAKHDVEIKALLAILQRSVDEANQRLKVSEALERQTIKLLLTPEGLRSADPDVLTCTGDNCPKLVACPGPECSFPVKK